MHNSLLSSIIQTHKKSDNKKTPKNGSLTIPRSISINIFLTIMYALSSGAVRYFSDQETLERYWINSGLLVSGFGSLIIAAGLVSLVIAALIMGMVYFMKFSYQICNGLYRFLLSNPFQRLPKIIAEKPSLPK